MTYTTVRFIKTLLILTMLFLVAGCGSKQEGSASNQGTGSIAAKLVWSNSKTTAKTVASAPSGVTTVRITISGGGLNMVQSFAASLGRGTIDSVPVGQGYTLMAEGLSSSDVVLYQGQVDNVQVTAFSTTDVGTITMSPTVAPAAPSGLTATPGDTVADLSWNAVDGASYYRIYYSFSPGVTKSSPLLSGNYTSTGSSVGNMVNGYPYYFAVSAVNSYGESDLSNEIVVYPMAQLTNLLSNGDFESGTSGWWGWDYKNNIAANTIYYDTSGNGHNGNGYLWYSGNGINVANSYSVSVPSNASEVYFRFWYKVSTQEIGSGVWDTLTISIRDANNNLQTVKTLTNLNATSGWVQSEPIDLFAYQGQQIAVHFLATSDTSLSTSWLIDDIEVGYR